MATDLENVHVLDIETRQLGVNQIGIDLVHRAHDEDDPVLEVVVVTRSKSGVLDVVAHLNSTDSLAKMTEHLTLQSGFHSAHENMVLVQEQEEEYDD